MTSSNGYVSVHNKEIQFTVIMEERNQKTFTFKNLESDISDHSIVNCTSTIITLHKLSPTTT